MPAGFHSYTHLHPLCRQITVKFLRSLAVLQSPLLQFPGIGIHKSNLLEARMIVTPYNNHVGSFLPGLGWFAPPKSTRAWEPTLLWNQLHSESLASHARTQSCPRARPRTALHPIPPVY